MGEHILILVLKDSQGARLLRILNSPQELLLPLLFASTLAFGACLWLVWTELRRVARSGEKSRREVAEQMQSHLAALNEKLSGELARHRREAEQMERNLEVAVRRRLDELQALLESLRAIEAKLQGRVAPPAAEAPPGAVAKEARGGFSVIARPPKTGSGEPQI
jgi:hypothetical protein